MWSLDQFKTYLNQREEKRADKSQRSESNLDINSSPNKFSHLSEKQASPTNIYSDELNTGGKQPSVLSEQIIHSHHTT